MTKTALDLLSKAKSAAPPVPKQSRTRTKKAAASKSSEPDTSDERTYHTVELVVPMELYRAAKARADEQSKETEHLGRRVDMAYVGRRILFAAMDRDPVGPAPVEPDKAPEQTSVKRKYDFDHLAYEPKVIPNVAKTRDNTRGSDAAYKNYRFRMPKVDYLRIRDAIVGVPGQTVTHVLEAGLQHFANTGSY
jgi:hypothetical protein